MKRIKYIVLILLCIAIVISEVAVVINVYMFLYARKYILNSEKVKNYEVDYVLVLGAKVYDDGRLCLMLEDRVKAGVLLYDKSVAPVIVMSGDSHEESYDEVNPMKERAVELGVPIENILTDPKGLSTFDSMLRIREEFNAEKVIIVTQKYHLYRSVYVARKLGIEAYGYAAEDIHYYGQMQRDIREVVARVKDFFYVIVKR